MNEENQVSEVQETEENKVETTESVETGVEATVEPEAAQAEQIEEAAPSEPEAEKTHRKPGAEKRISELVKEREEAKREAEFLRQQLESQGGAPQPDQFDDYDAYLVARTKWEIKQEERTQAHEREKVVREEMARQKQMEWTERVQAAKSKYQDFEQVAFNPELPISDAVSELVTGSEKGADLAYYLGKNPQTAYRLSQMSQIEAAMELGRIETQLAKPKTVTSAPEPIKPIGNSGEAPARPLDELSYSEYKRARGF